MPPYQFPTYRPQVADEGQLPSARQSVSPVSQRGVSQLGRGIEDLGRGVAGAGRNIADMNARIRDQQDMAVIQDTVSELRRAKIGYLDNHVYKQEGRLVHDNREILDEIRDSWTQQHEALFNRLNERQKLKAHSLFLAQDDDFRSKFDKHISTQADRYAQQAYNDFKAGALRDAFKAGTTGDTFELEASIASGLGAIEEYGKLHGWSQDAIEAEEELFKTQAYVGAFGEMLRQPGNLDEIKSYFDQVKGELDTKLLRDSKLEDVIQGRLNGRALDTQAVQMSIKYRSTDGLHFDLKSAMSELDEIQNPAVRRELKDRVLTYSEEINKGRKAHDSPRKARLLKIIHQKGRLDTSSPDYTEMSVEGQEDVHRALRAKRNEGRERQNQLDQVIYYSFMALPENVRSSMDVTGGFAADASPVMQARLEAVQRKLVESQGVRSGLLDRLIQSEVGLNPRLKSKKKQKAFRAYVNSLYVEWLKDPKNSGNPPIDVAKDWALEGITEVETWEKEAWYSEMWNPVKDLRDVAPEEYIWSIEGRELKNPIQRKDLTPEMIRGESPLTNKISKLSDLSYSTRIAFIKDAEDRADRPLSNLELVNFWNDVVKHRISLGLSPKPYE